MKRYTLEQFEKKLAGQRKICCGVNYTDGTHDTIMSSSCSQIVSYIKNSGKEVDFIATKI